jgi:hypothetical protein
MTPASQPTPAPTSSPDESYPSETPGTGTPSMQGDRRYR